MLENCRKVSNCTSKNAYLYRVLRNAALVEYLENTLENPVSDGGWKQKEMGATRCSNVRANYANSEFA